MGRPRKQIVDYFPHYADASDRRTLVIIQNKYGNDGYAFWFKLLQILCRQSGHYLQIENGADWEFLVAKTHVSDTEKAKQIMDTLALLGAIDEELYKLNCIWSDNLIENLKTVYEKRTDPLPAKPSIRNGKLYFLPENEVSDTETGDCGVRNAQSKVKESKVKESKEVAAAFEKYLKELKERFTDLNFDEELEKFTLYWTGGKRTLKNPKLALLKWMNKAREIKKENKNNGQRARISKGHSRQLIDRENYTEPPGQS